MIEGLHSEQLGEEMYNLYLVVCWMSELPVAVRTCEPGLVGVGHQVIVEAVLTGEGCSAQSTLEWSQSSVAPETIQLNFFLFPDNIVTCSVSGECCRL